MFITATSFRTQPGSFASLRRLSAVAAVVTALSAPLMASAQADAYAEVNRLVRTGELSDALAKADQYLAGKPTDPQMRFLKGVIQTESGKTADAVATFAKLTEDYPELPEPYNNLAVLYAGQSQFDKARAALEMAIRTNPSYATAHENLGDVYAKLASQAYSKALQLDANNTGAAPKLSLIRNLFSGSKSVSQPAAPAATAESAKANTAPSAPVTASAPTPAPKAVEPTAVAGANEQVVEQAVMSWAQAWSSKDMKGYLGAYAPNFTPTGGQARNEWESERRSRIVPRKRIDVDISDLDVSINGDRASARFLQAYRSDAVNVTSRKTLDMIRQGNRWLIVRESTGS